MADNEENEPEWEERLRFRDDEEMDFFTELALHEAERWIQAVTRKKFEHADDFRKSLSNGVLLCELLNNIKPGVIKRINKLPGAIAGLDNINVFLGACEKHFGLNKTQLFDASDLEDLSTRAIADENEYLLKQETDRRSRNVAITVYWLGRAVSHTFKGPTLDTSAFSSLVHSHGNKNILSDECLKNGNNAQTPREGAVNSHNTSGNNKHIRDSSYDSLGSYERESESSFDELDHGGTMPVSSEMREIKRYSSTSSLSMPRGLSLSTASHDSMYSDDKQDGMYRSSPDLSQGSMPHTRSSSTDSGGEGGYYGNHSRQSSGSIGDYPTRRMSTTSSNRKSTSALPDPLQFIKVGGAQSLAEQAKKQMEVSKEGHIMRGKLDTTPTASVSDEPDWQSNFNSWKSRRKSHSHLPEKSPALEEEEQATRKQKTFSQIMAEKNQRGGHGPGMHVYPQDDNDSGIEGFKSHDKTANKRSTSETSKQKSSKIKDVAPWAAESSGEENSQSDSETNNSHQSGDTDSVFSDKSTPSKILSDDDTWVKQKQIVPTRATPVRTQKPSDNVSKVWESNLNDSPSKKEEKRFRDIPTNNSAKIKDITKSFEQKDKEANASPVVTPRRSDARKSIDTSPLWKTNDITDGSSGRYRNSGKEPTSPISPKTPKSLLPHDQRYGHNKPDIQDSPKQDKLSVSQSPRDRYLQNVSPIHSSTKLPTKSLDAVHVSPAIVGLPKPAGKAPGPEKLAKPTREKIAAAKAKFEQSNNVDAAPGQSKCTLPSKPESLRSAVDLPNREFDVSTNSMVQNILSEQPVSQEHYNKIQNNENDNKLKMDYINYDMFAIKQNDIEDSGKNTIVEGTDDISHNYEASQEISKTASLNSGMKTANCDLYHLPDVTQSGNCIDTTETLVPDKNVTKEEKNEVEEGDEIDPFDAHNLSEIAEDIVAEVIRAAVSKEREHKKYLIEQDTTQYQEYSSDGETNAGNAEEECVINSESIPEMQMAFTMPVAKLREENEQSSNIDTCSSIPEEIEGDIPDGLSPDCVRNAADMDSMDDDYDDDFEDDHELQDLCHAYEQVLGGSVDEEAVDEIDARPQNPDLFDIQEVDEVEMVPELPSSDIPALPPLPKSQIPDIIESNNVKNVSLVDNVENWLMDKNNDHYADSHGNESHSNENAHSMHSTEEPHLSQQSCSPLIDDHHQSNLPLNQDHHFQKEEEIEDKTEKKSKDMNKYVERMIKICQRPDNNRGFGFTLVGGLEKRQPVIVQRVSLGSEASDDVFYEEQRSAADVQEVLVDDEILEINGRSVSMLTMAQVQGIVDHGVKRGQIELKIRRYEQEDEPYDSMNEEEGTENQSNITNNAGSGGGKMDVQSDSSLSAEPSSLEDHSVTQSSRPDDSTNLRLMDQLIQEQERETNNNQKNKRAPSPVAAEPPVTVSIALSNESAPSGHMTSYTADMQAPSDVTTTEERPTISMRRGPPAYQPDNSPVVLRRDKSAALQNSPSPPTPPRNQPPPLSQTNDTNGTDSGFGPPAALMRWQRRPKSEYRSPSEMEQERSKRLSSTLPYNSGATFSFDAKNFSKDDADVDRVSKDFVETVSISKPLESSPNSYKFNDSSRMEDWQQKHEQEQKPKQYQPIELNIPKVEHMTPQPAAPARKVAQMDAPDLADMSVSQSETPLSPQEKFEADQQRIRLQYEADKKRAEQAEQGKQALNTDKFMKSMEFQVQQTKKEAANQNLLNSQPINEPRFTSEPMTIKLPANSQGRQLMIDPRNQGDTDDSMLPEYSFRVDLKQNETAPPLRTLEAQSGLSHDDLLERERQRIREEEKQKLDRERQEWLARQQREQSEHERKLREQEERLRQETQRLQQEQERVEREKALLAEKKAKEDMISPRYTSVTNTSVYLDSRSPTGSSQVSPTARSGPPSLDPKFHESSRGAKVPPPTAPKPGAKDKARLTRDDLLAMNRKATPLAKPELTENSAQNEPLSPTMREAPSKRELHSLNAVPKPRYHYGGTWIKDEEREPKTNSKVSSNTQENDRPFVIGKRSDLIHQRDYSNPNDHWLVREAEKRRLADRDNVESVTARAGPTRPSESSLVNRFRSDQEPPPRRSQRLSYPSSQFGDPRDPPTSSRPLSTSGSNLRSMDRNPETQFNVRSQNSLGNSNPGLSQTLPPSFSFSANARDSAPNSKPPRSLTNESDPVIAVSGKQKCSHCGEELGFGAAMVIESLGLYYHVQCFRCCVCHVALGSGAEGADVRVRVDKLHCRNCYSNDEAGLKFSKV